MTDVNDLLRRVLHAGEVYREGWAKAEKIPEGEFPPVTFKEAHDYLDSLEQVNEGPKTVTGDHFHTHPASDARLTRIESVLRRLVLLDQRKHYVDCNEDGCSQHGTYNTLLKELNNA